MNPSHFFRQRGAVAVMVAMSLLVVLSATALVIDVGMAYMVKARLNAAVDSAALAAARAAPIGANQAAQTASARSAAAAFFSANIPPNYLLSKPQLLSTEVTFDYGKITIDVRAEAPMRLSLVKLAGISTLTPYASAQTVRKDLDMSFVIDTSGSLKDSAANVRSSAISFLKKFSASQDRVALMHFASGAVVDSPIRLSARGFDRDGTDGLMKKINQLKFEGGTSSAEGMWHAREQLNNIALKDRSSLRVIVFFSDGEPTSFGSFLNFQTSQSSKGKPTTTTMCTSAGAIDSTMTGLYDLGEGYAFLSNDCNLEYLDKNWKGKTVLPDWYNGHAASATSGPNEFPVVNLAKDPVRGARRVVQNDFTADNIKRVARNLPESIATKARNENIYVFTLGMGSALKNTVLGETGEDVLKCMANVADAPLDCRQPTKPIGMYCYAANDADLMPCFSRLASAILRISK